MPHPSPQQHLTRATAADNVSLQHHRSYRRFGTTKQVPNAPMRNAVHAFEFRVEMRSFLPTRLCNSVPIARATESTCRDKAASVSPLMVIGGLLHVEKHPGADRKKILPNIVLAKDDLKTISLANPRISRARPLEEKRKQQKQPGFRRKKSQRRQQEASPVKRNGKSAGQIEVSP